ncbi:uncharacterized protein LOC119462403 [Dermacentor silvarum]|uniref:uncharacterized protein LOC119462403 n=1 Tax=Dermacentor silvarum TaxID=543639 RepID=UPI0018993674|nr:uncharacterized protein LOC119462403 [Dermacentor silvarum]
MIGFRTGLSTQDAMKLIKYQAIDRNTRDTRAILGLDLEKVFDSVLHSFVLSQISSLGLGKYFHDYTRSFLADRKATLGAGDLVLDSVRLDFRGKPQGSVISPTLFNLTMIGLSRRLSQVEGINHTIYADDIIIWCTGGSDGLADAALQEAIEILEEYLKPTGLRCSPRKSVLVIYRPRRRGPKPKGWKPVKDVDITLRRSEDGVIPKVDSLRVLGMTIESNGSNKLTVSKLAKKMDNAIRLIRRVANRHNLLEWTIL